MWIPQHPLMIGEHWFRQWIGAVRPCYCGLYASILLLNFMGLHLLWWQMSDQQKHTQYHFIFKHFDKSCDLFGSPLVQDVESLLWVHSIIYVLHFHLAYWSVYAIACYNHINSLAIGNCGSNFKSLISKHITEDKLGHSLWKCSQVTSNHLSQCWSRSMLPCVIIRPHWVKCVHVSLNFWLHQWIFQWIYIIIIALTFRWVIIALLPYMATQRISILINIYFVNIYIYITHFSAVSCMVCANRD